MQTILLDVLKIPVDDPVAFTFFTGYMAMAAASVFFLFERGTVADKWKTSLLISGMITGIASVHYYYMRDYYLSTLRWSGRNGHGESNFPLSWKQQNQPVNGTEPSTMRPFGPKQSAG